MSVGEIELAFEQIDPGERLIDRPPHLLGGGVARTPELDACLGIALGVGEIPAQQIDGAITVDHRLAALLSKLEIAIDGERRVERRLCLDRSTEREQRPAASRVDSGVGGGNPAVGVECRERRRVVALLVEIPCFRERRMHRGPGARKAVPGPGVVALELKGDQEIALGLHIALAAQLGPT